MGDPGRLEIHGLELSFGGLRVIESLDLDAEPGRLLALIGPNGAGKTSVLNCISGIYRPTAGTIRLGDRPLTGLPPHRVAAAGVARTFQHGEMYPHLTVIENLLMARHGKMRTGVFSEGLFWGKARRAELAERAKVEEVIEFVELEPVRDQPVGGLPFGVQQLVGFARALAMEPQLLLLDEPSAGLPREEKEDLARFILRIRHETDVTMVWVEHDMQMVGDLADDIVVLNYGRYVTHGTPERVLNDPDVIEIYLGSSGSAGDGKQEVA